MCSDATSRRSKSASLNAEPPRLSRHSMAANTPPRRNSGSTSAERNSGTGSRSVGRGSSGSMRSERSCSMAQPARPSPRSSRRSAGGRPGPSSGNSNATRRRPPRRTTQMRTDSQLTSRRTWRVALRSNSLKLLVAACDPSADAVPSAEMVRSMTSSWTRDSVPGAVGSLMRTCNLARAFAPAPARPHDARTRVSTAKNAVNLPRPGADNPGDTLPSKNSRTAESRMAKEHKRLGDVLLDEKLITPQQLADAVSEQRRTGQLLGVTLTRMGSISEDVLLKYLQQQLGLPLIDLNDVVIDEPVLALVKEDMAKKYSAMPVEIEGRSTLVVAMADPLNAAALEDLRFHAGMFIKPVLARTAQIQEAVERYYHIDNSVNEVIQNIIHSEDDLEISTVREEEQNATAIDDLIKEAEGRPIVRLTNWLLHRAIEERASDVHIEPQDRDLIVRFRIDGLLQEIQRLPKWTQGAVVSRIKVLSNLDIAEKRQPQDGRLVLDIANRRVDMRV